MHSPFSIGGIIMIINNNKRSIISVVALLLFAAAGYYVPPSQAQQAQFIIFMIIFGTGYLCTTQEWNSPISAVTCMGLFAYGLLFLNKQNTPPYLVSGWQWYIGALIALEIFLLIWRIRKPQTL